MDTQHVSAALLALHQIRGNRRHVETEAAEDAYYKRHTPADSHVPRIASIVAGVAIGFLTIGLWLS